MNDTQKIEDAVLALLQLTLHDRNRAWKGFDWEVLERLHAKGLIENPKTSAKSVELTEMGLKKSQGLFEELFVSKT